MTAASASLAPPRNRSALRRRAPRLDRQSLGPAALPGAGHLALCRWSIVPVIIAIQFSFNAGRSLTAWQGFSLTRWYFDDPVEFRLE